MSFRQLGEVKSTKLAESDLDNVWNLTKSASLPGRCDPALLSVGAGKAATAQGGSSWLVGNSGAACTIRPAALMLSANGKVAAKLQTSADGRALPQVLPTGAYARFQVVTDGPCVPTKNEMSKRQSVQLHLVASTGGADLGNVTALSPACKGQAVRLLLLPFTEAVHESSAPAGLSARVMTASVEQKGGKVAATLFVTNSTGTTFHTDTCPSLTTTLHTARIEAAERSALACDHGFVVAAHSSVAINLVIAVDLSKKDFVLADVGAYLSFGLGDDASRARTDA